MRAWAMLLALTGCEVDSALPPLREVEVESEDGAPGLTTTTVSSAADLTGVDRVRGHLVIDAAGPLRLPDVIVIDGDLRIVGSEARPLAADVTLPHLGRVGGNVEVGWTSGVARLTAPKLADIGGHLALHDGTWALALPALVSVNGDVRLGTGELTALELGGLRRVGGALTVIAVTPAQGVSLALALLEEVHGDVTLRAGTLAIAAPRCLSIGGDLTVEDARVALELDALREVRGEVRIERSRLDVFALGGLRAVGDDLVLDRVEGPFAVFELNVLQAVGGDLRLSAVAGLGVVTLSELGAIGGSLTVEGAPGLTQVNAIHISSLGGSLILKDGAVVTVSMDQLGAVGGDLVVQGNAGWQASLQQLTEVTGAVRFVDQGLRFTGLQALATIGGDLRLVRVSGSGEFDELRFDNLRTVGGTLGLEGSRTIEKLTANLLIAVGHAGAGDFIVRANEDLVSLLFGELGAVAGAILVRDNPLLASADALRELDDVVSGGAAEICDNLGGDACIEE